MHNTFAVLGLSTETHLMPRRFVNLAFSVAKVSILLEAKQNNQILG